jgi:hypothetical protein
MQQNRLKNRITRQESRRPSPKTTGPAVPDENLHIEYGGMSGELAAWRMEKNVR